MSFIRCWPGSAGWVGVSRYKHSQKPCFSKVQAWFRACLLGLHILSLPTSIRPSLLSPVSPLPRVHPLESPCAGVGSVLSCLLPLPVHSFALPRLLAPFPSPSFVSSPGPREGKEYREQRRGTLGERDSTRHRSPARDARKGSPRGVHGGGEKQGEEKATHARAARGVYTGEGRNRGRGGRNRRKE